MEELAASFAKACEAVLDGKNPEQQREADKWIVEFQKQPEAWAVVDLILAQPDDRISVEVQFLAAKTFHTKIRYDFADQVAKNARAELREKLLMHLERHFGDRKRKQVVTTQLSLAVAALAIQMEEWESPIKDLASRFGSGSGAGANGSGVPESALCLIEILQIIPEDLQSRLFVITDERKSQLNMEMYDFSADVLRFLSSSAESSGADSFVQLKILECLREWIMSVEFPGEALAASPLLTRVFRVIEEGSELLDSAVLVVVELVHTYSNVRDPGHTAVMGIVAPRVFALTDLYARAANEDDDELCTSLAKVFAHTARAYARQLLRSTSPGETDAELSRIMELALAGPRHASPEVAAVTWHSWIKIIETAAGSPHLGQQASSGQTLFMERRGLLTPYFEELVQCGLRHLRIPDDVPDPQNISSMELGDEIVASRRDIEDILRECAQLLTPGAVLTAIKTELESAADAFLSLCQRQQHQQSLGHPSAWSRVEALLNATIPVGRDFSPASSDSASSVVIDFVMQVCLRLPNASILLRETICCVFGEYARFLHFNPQKLEPALNYELDTIVAAPKLGATVSRAIGDIAQACRGDLLGSASRLVDVAFSAGNAIATADRIELLVAVALAVQFRPYEEALEAMRHVTRPAVQVLRQAEVALKDAGAQQPSESDVELAIRTIDTFIRYGWVDPAAENGHADGRHGQQQQQQASQRSPPGLILFQEVWQSLCAITEGLCSSSVIVEKLAALYKVVVRGFGAQFQPYFATLMNLMVSAFRKSGMSPFLYATGIAIEEFATIEPSHARDYAAVLGALSEAVFQILNSREAMEKNPDLVEDFFITMDRCIRTIPIEVVQASFFPAVFYCGAVGATISHRHASQALLIFMESALDTGILRDGRMNVYDETISVIRTCFNENGQTLVNNLVAGIAGAMPASRIGSTAEGSLSMTLYTVGVFLRELPDTDVAAFSNSLHQALRVGCPHVSGDLADSFVRGVCRSIGDAFEFQNAVYDFSSAARLRLQRTVDKP